MIRENFWLLIYICTSYDKKIFMSQFQVLLIMNFTNLLKLSNLKAFLEVSNAVMV